MLRNWNGRRVFVILLALWLVIMTGAVTVFTWSHPRQRAVLGMGWGLIALWIGLGGTLMHRFRERIRTAVLRIPVDWRLRFIGFCTLLALLEEVITTTMTNLAPLFGVKTGEASPWLCRFFSSRWPPSRCSQPCSIRTTQKSTFPPLGK